MNVHSAKAQATALVLDKCRWPTQAELFVMGWVEAVGLTVLVLDPTLLHGVFLLQGQAHNGHHMFTSYSHKGVDVVNMSPPLV